MVKKLSLTSLRLTVDLLHRKLRERGKSNKKMKKIGKY